MNTKESTMKEVIALANAEIFEGKSKLVKNHLEGLMGTRDGIKARLAMVTMTIESQLEAAEKEIENFCAMSVDEAHNYIVYNNSITRNECTF